MIGRMWSASGGGEIERKGSSYGGTEGKEEYPRQRELHMQRPCGRKEFGR